jgi:two-component system cell cycle sensor histidine kinase/response regulator CckA
MTQLSAPVESVEAVEAIAAPRLPISARRWWQCLFEQAEDAHLVCLHDGRVVKANQKAMQWLGLAAPAIARRKVRLFDFLSEPAVRKLTEWFKRTSGRQATLSAISFSSEGQLRLLADLQTTPLGHGYSLVSLKDTSRRWRMESHLQRLCAAVDSTPDVIFLTDAHYKITFVNPAFQSTTGYTIEEALGQTADFLRAPAANSCMQEYLAAITQGLDWQGELANLRRDGSVYPVEAAISPIPDREGKIMGYVALERDISVRKRLQAELRLEHNYVLSIIDSLDSAVYTIDRQFRLSHINNGWKKLPPQHGWLDVVTPPEAGQRLLDYVNNPEKRAELEALFNQVLAEGKPQEIQASPLGGRHWLIKIAPWLHEDEVRGLLYIVTDQTKIHQIQRQLYQAQKMETIGTIAAGVAHDFNNLLQVIRGNITLLAKADSLGELLRQPLQQIDVAAGRAAAITQQLLSFSRVSEEKVSTLDFNQAIQEAAQLVRCSSLSKVELVLRPAPKPLFVRIESSRAQQLLLNLCVNAQDAMPSGGQIVLANSRVKLSATQAAKTRSPAGSQFMCCSVSDTGTGIPAEILGRIFEPFFTTKSKGRGTGLGLAIAQSVIYQASGFIEVESRAGLGTTFHIYLPLAQASVPGEVKGARPASGKRTGRVLVVDDLDLVLNLTKTYLEMEGYTVSVAPSAEAAIEFLNRGDTKVDLIFTDYHMAGMNGQQLIDFVASGWPDMKFILASGYLERLERQELEKQPRVRLLDKPFNMAEAAELIAEALAIVEKPIPVPP